MYIEPFWTGVLSCLFAEFTLFFLSAVWRSIKIKTKKK